MRACPLVIKCFGETLREVVGKFKVITSHKKTSMRRKRDKNAQSKNFSFGSTWSNLVVPKLVSCSQNIFFKNPFTRFFI